MTRLLEVVIGSVVGGLVALAVTLPLLVGAHGDFVRADRERRIIETRCTVFVDGSAKCPADTFEVGDR